MAPAVAIAGTSLSFSDHGKQVKSLAFEELASKSPSEEVRIFEPHEEEEMTFRAFPLASVLDQAYGPRWRQSEEVLFVCADGYRNPVEVADLMKNPGWLAYQREGNDFAITEKKPKLREIPLAPFYLIRATGRDLAARSPEQEGWPYQVVGIDLIEFADRFPGLTPPKGASASAKLGFLSFRKHCVTCHSLGGQGGTVGPELNAPVSVTTYYKETWLKKWIADPSSIRSGTTMPAVIPPGRGQSKAIDEIVDYLKAMASEARK